MKQGKANTITDIRKTVIDLQRRIHTLNTRLKDREDYDQREFDYIVDEVKCALELISSQPKNRDLDKDIVAQVVQKLEKIAG